VAEHIEELRSDLRTAKAELCGMSELIPITNGSEPAVATAEEGERIATMCAILEEQYQRDASAEEEFDGEVANVSPEANDKEQGVLLLSCIEERFHGEGECCPIEKVTLEGGQDAFFDQNTRRLLPNVVSSIQKLWRVRRSLSLKLLQLEIRRRIFGSLFIQEG
jgi:hypothetical protein